MSAARSSRSPRCLHGRCPSALARAAGAGCRQPPNPHLPQPQATMPHHVSVHPKPMSASFFCSVYAKAQAGQSLEAIETIASLWMDEHPEYVAELADVNAALQTLSAGADDQNNAFFAFVDAFVDHRAVQHRPATWAFARAVELLTHRLDSLHDAHHAVMECLGQMLWESQRSGRAPDGQAYVACVQRRATQD
jgi:hypothetical protein